MLPCQVVQELLHSAVVGRRSELELVDMGERLSESLGQAREELLSRVALEGEQLFVGGNHVGGVYLHPRQLSLHQEDHRVEQTFEIVFPAEGQPGVRSPAAEPQRAAKLFPELLGHMLAILDERSAQFEISEIDLMPHLALAN